MNRTISYFTILCVTIQRTSNSVKPYSSFCQETRLFTLRRVHRSQSTAGHQQRPTANADERGLSEVAN
ncbi:hypothetical protein P3S67_010708 [Capsicum chacoense]